MKIILVHNEYQQRGGEEVVFEQERKILESAGHDVVVYRRSNNEIGKLTPLERLTLAKRTVWASDTRREFARLLARENPDLVHVHNTFVMISPSIYSACHENKRARRADDPQFPALVSRGKLFSRRESLRRLRGAGSAARPKSRMLPGFTARDSFGGPYARLAPPPAYLDRLGGLLYRAY
jgi:hypothetical protein